MMTKEEMPACPVATTVALIGSKWKLLIIRNLRQRPWRFNELKKDLQGVSQKVLTDSLRSLEEDGVIVRTVYPEVPPRVEYALSDLGKLHAPHPGLHGAVGEGLSEAGPGRVTRENKRAGRAPLAYPRVFSLLALSIRP